MTAIMPKVSAETDAKYVEQVISFNVRMLLTALNRTQADLAKALGVTRSAMSIKLAGKSTWSVPDVVNTANYLGTSMESLIDDSLMRRMGVAQDTDADMEKSAVSDGLSDDGTPRGIRTHNPRLKRTLL